MNTVLAGHRDRPHRAAATTLTMERVMASATRFNIGTPATIGCEARDGALATDVHKVRLRKRRATLQRLGIQRLTSTNAVHGPNDRPPTPRLPAGEFVQALRQDSWATRRKNAAELTATYYSERRIAVMLADVVGERAADMVLEKEDLMDAMLSGGSHAANMIMAVTGIRSIVQAHRSYAQGG